MSVSIFLTFGIKPNLKEIDLQYLKFLFDLNEKGLSPTGLFSNDSESWEWARLESGAQNSIWVFRVDGRHPNT